MNRRLKQQGFTLIELMVGLVVTLIGVLSMVAVYQQAGRNGTELKYGAYLDGQIQSGLLVAEKLIQNAGYQPLKTNIETASYNSDLKLYKNVVLDGEGVVTSASLIDIAAINTSGVNGSAIIWKEVTNGVDQFSGLYADSENGGLWRITGSSMDILTQWKKSVSIIEPSPFSASEDSEDVFAGVGKVSISLVRSNCSPYGMSDMGMTGLYKVKLSATPYSGSQNPQRAEICLGNFQAS